MARAAEIGQVMVEVPLSRRQSLFGLAAGAAILGPSRANGAPSCGRDIIILTVAGLIEAPNRAPFDAKRDRFLDHNNLSFEKAHAFSAASLSAFPQITVAVKKDGGEARYSGPSLKDVLSAARPSPNAKTARLSALDGYGAELVLADVARQEWVLATASDGKPFSIGGFGPLQAVRQLPAGEKATEEEEQKWVYSLYYIELMA
ncbi:MAG: molybdopterin-dependent oxidoreductase [Rhodomicrobium sp.]